MILFSRAILVVFILLGVQQNFKIFAAFKSIQEDDSLLHHVDLGADEINFSEQDFENECVLCTAIERELAHISQTDEQQNDLHIKLSTIALRLKQTLDRCNTQLSEVRYGYGREITVLMHAAWRGKIDVVKVLLNYPDQQEVQLLLSKLCVEGFTALHFAAIDGQIEIAHMMLLKSKNPYQLLTHDTNHGWGAEGLAYKWCNYKTAAFLNAACDAYDQGGTQGLRSFLENFEITVSQEQSCSCCRIL